MRIGGRTIGLGFYGRIAELHNRLVRARYFRGHGVHSPFVYNIVREVFMRGELLPGDRAAVPALRGAGVPERRAIQLQNVAIHCGYGTFGLNSCGCRILYPDAGPAPCGDAGVGRRRGRSRAYRRPDVALRGTGSPDVVPSDRGGASFDDGGQ